MSVRIGILTGGGDAPGLNGIIESCVRSLNNQGIDVIGICDGFEGIFNEKTVFLNQSIIAAAHAQAGTILGTSNKSRIEDRQSEFIDKYNRLNLHGLIVCGGDGTFAALHNVSKDLKIIGLPKTIDNDLAGTDFTFGYDTACSVVAESVDALRYTAQAHRRVIFLETMGRTTGWIALGGGLASYADGILIPERPFDRGEFSSFLRKKLTQGARGAIVVVAEGAVAKNEKPLVAFKVPGSPQPERYGGIAQALARWVEAEVGWESRHVVLGHLQRSKQPTTTDRFLTLSMGVEASRMVIDGAWGQAVVFRQGRIQRAPLSDIMQPARLIEPNHKWIELVQSIGSFI